MNKFLIIAIVVVFTSCKKQHNTPQSFKVKLLHSICNDIIFEIKDPVFYHLGQANWNDVTNGSTYSSAFEQKNNCANIVVDANNEATVQLIEETNIMDCSFCLALYSGTLPTKKLSIKNYP